MTEHIRLGDGQRTWYYFDVRFVAPLLVLASCCTHCLAQLRIVQYNTGVVKSGLSTVLQQIGNENVGGVARPIDILVVEEQPDPAAVNNLAATLNGIYGPGTYTAAPYTGNSS